MDPMTWSQYWEGKTSGGHRSHELAFLDREAAEKLFHLQLPGTDLLDFGCGAGELTLYYARAFDSVVGVDFSSSMLEMAATRFEQAGVENVRLVNGDHVGIWDRLAPDTSFDVITAGQVVQYLSPCELKSFLITALGRLRPGGRLVLFDVIDPRIYWLLELGFFPRKPGMMWPAVRTSPGNVALTSARLLLHRLRRRLRGLPAREIGYLHHPQVFLDALDGAGVEVIFTGSLYYEYRYHVVIDRGPQDIPCA